MTRKAPRRVARLREVLGHPGNLLLLVRMAGWATALPVLKRVLPLPRLVELATPTRRRRGGTPAAATVVVLSRWVYRLALFRDNCLERSLITYRFLPETGARYSLVLGVRRGEEGPPGHAWLEIDGAPVHDSPESLAALVPILAFDGLGKRSVPDPAGEIPQGSSGTPATAGATNGEERRTEPQKKPHRPPRAG